MLEAENLTEAEIRSQKHNVKTSILTIDNAPRLLAARDTRGPIKLVADSENNVLRGAQILAPEGADSILLAAVAILEACTSYPMQFISCFRFLQVLIQRCEWTENHPVASK